MTPAATALLSLTLERTIRAPRPRVFAAFSSVDAMKNWLGPGNCRVDGGEMDFRPGGAYRLDMHSAEFGRVQLAGVYREIVPDRRLAFSWEWQGHPEMNWGVMEVSVEFSDADSGTRVTITHRGLAAPELREAHAAGWNGSLDRLERLFPRA